MNKFWYTDSNSLNTNTSTIDWAMVWSFISAWLGWKNLINWYWVLQNASLPESREQSIELIQTMVDVLVDNPELVEKYYWSWCTNELFEKIIWYHSQKSVWEDNRVSSSSTALNKIPKEMETEFNSQVAKWASHDIQAWQNKKIHLDQIQTIKAKYENLFQQYFNKYGISNEKTREYAVLRNVENIKADLLSKFIKKNIKGYRERFLKRLQEELYQSKVETLSKTNYIWEDLKLYQHITNNLKFLFQKHLMEDITKQMWDKSVITEWDEFKVIQSNATKDIYSLARTQTNLQRNALAFSEQKSNFADHFYNLIWELCICEYLQDVLSKKIQDHNVEVIKPGALDDIQWKVDMLIILTHKKSWKKKVARFDLKTTNSLTYLNAENSDKKVRPLWNTSAHLFWKNTETILSNDVVTLSVDPSLMHLLVAQKISNNPALVWQQDSYMKRIFEASSSQIKNSDKNVTNCWFTKDALVQQITRALLN